MKVSPLAPTLYPELPVLDGVRLASIEAGIKYRGRKDLCLIAFDKPATVAGVFTQSKCPSAAVDWCKKVLPRGKARCVVINSGNANAFTGVKGDKATEMTAKAAADLLGCNKNAVMIASTGVIGEPLDASEFPRALANAKNLLAQDGWHTAAQTIMTTDTYPKLATRSIEVEGKRYTLNGIAKGSGMIAPDMATMLSFLVTDMPIASHALQKMLSKAIRNTFNAITVDSDTSTSDTVLLFSCGQGKPIEESGDQRLKKFKRALSELLHELAMLVVRDGEGATKQVGIEVAGAKNKRSARKVAMAIANSPLVKTAIAGEDANWGRIVMAVGKAGEPADRDRLQISFGDIRVAVDGERDPDYDEEQVSRLMKRDEIEISVDLGIGKSSAKVWTCDLTKEYVAINGDYRS